ncbi:MAG TPA: winged helix-turn-helix domain-containing protein [Longimicrobium sp.]|nr:winged helix-turn-helix domain-containing protein [Longimicrobium sp.]
MIDLRLDRSAPMPLYHQIVQALRWKIGTGALRPGAPLPPIREAAEQWGVNYHTVRRAYGELAAQGWVESVQGSGTQVAAALPGEAAAIDDSLDQWVDEIVAAGRDRFGLTAEELAALVRERGRVLRVVMVECNDHQSTFLAQQLEQAWPVEAIPWSLHHGEAPPQLPIIGTYFHHSEMKAMWPDRIGDMHFVTLYLDPALRDRVEREAGRRGARVLRLVERDPATAQEMAAGVSTLLGPRFQVRPLVGDPDEVVRTLAPDELLLVAPRLWDTVSAGTRADERVFDVRHVVVPEDLPRVWNALSRAAVPTEEPLAE